MKIHNKMRPANKAFKIGSNVQNRTKFLDRFNFYLNIAGLNAKDKVSGQKFNAEALAGLEAGRPGFKGQVFSESKLVVEDEGLLTYGNYENLVDNPEDTSLWSGTGPWAQIVTLAATGTYTLSTDLSGATVSVTAGTATIDAPASATYNNPDQFVVTATGTLTVITDTADPKAQITDTAYKLPYKNGIVPFNYSDADDGPKMQITPDEIGSVYTGPGGTRNMGMPKLLDALDGMADGDELVIGDQAWVSYDPVNNAITEESDGVWRIDVGSGASAGTGAYVYFHQSAGFLSEDLIEGKFYQCTFVGKMNIPGNKFHFYTGIAGDPQYFAPVAGTDWEEFSVRFLAGSSPAYLRGFHANSPGYSFWVKDVSIKQISPARGEMVVEWTPMFDYDVLQDSTSLPILNFIDGTTFLRFRKNVDGFVQLYDGTTWLTLSGVTVEAGVTYIIRVIYGPHPDYADALKMQLIVTNGIVTLESSVAAFKGSFSPGDFVSPAYMAELPQYTKLLKVYKRPQSW